MKAPRLYLLCITVSVILTAGCTTNNTSVELGSGVVMKDFDMEFSDIYSGECVDLGILVKNTGSVEAKKVFVELLGLEQDWYDGKSWNKGCRTTDGGPWIDREKSANERECRWQTGSTPFSLQPPNQQMGTDGETHMCTWTYIAPQLPGGADVTYTATLRIFYQYQTDVVKAITLMTQDEMKALSEQGKTLPADTQSSTSSPVTIDVVTSTPLRMYADKVEFPVEINIANAGDGFTCVGSSSWDNIKDCRTSQQLQKDTWRKIRLEIEADKPITLSEDCEDPMEFTLYKGKSNTITCTATVSRDSLPSKRVQSLIRVHAYYHYITDNEIQITVHGGVS